MEFAVRREPRCWTFSPPRARARVMMVPDATTAPLIEKVLRLGENQHHAWGVKEMLAAGIEVSVLTRYRAGLERLGQDWRLPDTRGYDLIYSNHNRLVRTPLARQLRLPTPPFVSLVYAGEPVLLPQRHHGLLCMTPRAFSRHDGRPNVRVRYAPWGIDTRSALHHPVSTDGHYCVSTGVTGRDFPTLFKASRCFRDELVVAARGTSFADCPPNVRVLTEAVNPWVIRDLYHGAYAGLVILRRDDRKREAIGWTNMLELMAVGLPVVKTRTGTLDDIVDLERIGAGILVDPERPDQIVSALERLRASGPLRRSMGEAGAAYVRAHLTMERFARPLLELVDAACAARSVG